MSKNEINKEQNILDYWLLIIKWKKFIIFNVAFITIIATIIAFILPKWYKSEASIKPASEGGFSIFSALMNSKGLGAVAKNFNVGGLQYSDLDYYVSLLKSRKISMKMIKKYDLKKKYDRKYYFETIDDLLGNSIFTPDPTSNTLHITVYDKEPYVAREMVTSYINFLNQTLDSLNLIEHNFTASILEKRLEDNELELKKAEDSLKAFQEKYHVVIPEEQIKSTILLVDKLEAQKLFYETQLKVIEINAGKNSPEYINALTQFKIIEKKLNQLNGQNKKVNDFFISYGYAPELMKKYFKYYRQVKIQEALYEMLYPLVEQTKLNASSSRLHFVIIDNPYLPEYKAKPKRALIILSGFFLALLLSIIYVFTIEYLKTNQDNK